jgi:hypothetical protein
MRIERHQVFQMTVLAGFAVLLGAVPIIGPHSPWMGFASLIIGFLLILIGTLGYLHARRALDLPQDKRVKLIFKLLILVFVAELIWTSFGGIH